MPTNDGFSGVSNCYVFKSRLQEYAQKVGLPTPVYETIKEGPSHEPSFRSTVIVNDVRYDSLLGFFNRKAAEHSAAEVALMELAKLGEVNECISQPVHETGLCKNLLQEYAQKMNYAIPMYQCRKDDAPGRLPHFSCTVEIGGIRYIGAAARTKKEAEIKVARTALLAIHSSASELSGNPAGNSQLMVIHCRKRAAELANKPEAEDTVNAPKAKKARFKRRALKNRLSGGKAGHAQVHVTDNLVFNVPANWEGSKIGQTNASGFQVVDSEPLSTEAARNCQVGGLNIEPIEREMSVTQGPFPHHIASDPQTGNLTAANSNQSGLEAPNVITSAMSDGEVTALAKEVNEATVHSTAANANQSGHEAANVITCSMFHGDWTAHTTVTNYNQKDYVVPSTVTSSMPSGGMASGGMAVTAKEVNGASRVGEVLPMVSNRIVGQMDSSFVIPGVAQQEEMKQTGISRA